jgi:hypothetical protein
MGGHGYRGFIPLLLLLLSLLFHSLLVGFQEMWITDQTRLIHYSDINFPSVCIIIIIIIIVGRNSVVGIATRYGLDCPEIESWSGVRFSASVQTGPGAHPATYTAGTGSFPGVERPGRGVDHPPSSSVKVKYRVEKPFLTLWAFVACCKVKFIIIFIISAGIV